MDGSSPAKAAVWAESSNPKARHSITGKVDNSFLLSIIFFMTLLLFFRLEP
jgi:hypothetical protein